MLENDICTLFQSLYKPSFYVRMMGRGGCEGGRGGCEGGGWV